MTTNTQIKWNTSGEELVKIYNTNLTGKVFIITGSNSGIGLETARVLSSTGVKIIIPCRTLEKAYGAVEHIKKTVPEADLVPMQLDLSDISSIKSFAQSFLELDLPLHLLMNNAGVISSTKTFTKDGFEMTFGVGHLGHFLLVQLLTEKIKASAPSRIINVSSCTNSQFLPKKGLDFDNLNAEKDGFSTMTNYGQTKLANIYHAKELQRRFDAEGVDVTAVSIHPGNVMLDSSLIRDISIAMVWDILSSMRNYKLCIREVLTRKNLAVGASTGVFCSISDSVVKGKFYCDNAVNTDFLHEEAENEELAKKLWDISERLVTEKI